MGVGEEGTTDRAPNRVGEVIVRRATDGTKTGLIHKSRLRQVIGRVREGECEVRGVPSLRWRPLPHRAACSHPDLNQPYMDDTPATCHRHPPWASGAVVPSVVRGGVAEDDPGNGRSEPV